MKKTLGKELNSIFSNVLSSNSAKWDWEKETPQIIIKAQFGHGWRIKTTHLGNLEYFSLGSDKKRVWIYNKPVNDVRYSTPEIDAELERIWNEKEKLDKEREKLLADKFYELKMVDDKIIEEYYQKAKSF